MPSFHCVCPAVQSESFALRHPGCQSMPSSSRHLPSEISIISAWWKLLSLKHCIIPGSALAERGRKLVDCGGRWPATVQRERKYGESGTHCVAVFWWWWGLCEQGVWASFEWDVLPLQAHHGETCYFSSVPWRKGSTSLAHCHPRILVTTILYSSAHL